MTEPFILVPEHLARTGRRRGTSNKPQLETAVSVDRGVLKMESKQAESYKTVENPEEKLREKCFVAACC